MTALMFAAKENKLGTISRLYELGADLLAKNAAGMTAAHFACQGDHLDALKLIKNYADDLLSQAQQTVDDSQGNRGEEDDDDKEFETPIVGLGGLDDGSSSMVNESSAGIQENEENSRLDKAVELLGYPAHHYYDCPSLNGTRPIHMCCNFNSLKCMKFLIESKVEADSVDTMGETPLHRAGRKNFFQAYDMLVAAGADESILNQMRETPKQLKLDATQY